MWTMKLQFIFFCVLINFICDGESLSRHRDDNIKALMAANNLTSPIPHNITYIDKAENLIRLPVISKYYEDKKIRKKSVKKAPKRTIQKIIKKNRSKIKKMYIIKMTSFPTARPKMNYENQDKFSPRQEEMTTFPSFNKKRMRKYNSKLPRNPMPFHMLQTKRINYKRDKRDAREIFILKDFDSLQFLKEKKDYNVVKAHFQKYW